MRRILSRRDFLTESSVALVSAGTLAACTAGRDISDRAVRRLASQMRGAVILPSSPDYDSARQVWNAAIDKHPRLIARCVEASDVQRCIAFAVDHALPLSVRAGGHHPAGTAIAEAGLVVDLSKMKAVRADPVSRRVIAQPGILARELHMATRQYGLAVPTGTVSTVGVAGLTLGGGEGWLSGIRGLTCDTLVGAEVVMADGSLRRASATENPDLYWALRGGGGNFGVVTSLEYDGLSLPEVVAGGWTYAFSSGDSVLRSWRDAVGQLPAELTSMVALSHAPDPLVFVGACYAGPGGAAANKALSPLERKDRLGGGFTGMPTAQWNTSSDTGAEPGLRYYATSLYLPALPDQAVDTLLTQFRAAPSDSATAFVWHLHGAFAQPAPTDTAYCHRRAQFMFGCLLRWSDPAQDDRHAGWARTFAAAMKPFSTGEVYGNFVSEIGDTWSRAAYGPNLDRLRAVKRRYDPSNIFRSNLNVLPAT